MSAVALPAARRGQRRRSSRAARALSHTGLGLALLIGAAQVVNLAHLVTTLHTVSGSHDGRVHVSDRQADPVSDSSQAGGEECPVVALLAQVTDRPGVQVLSDETLAPEPAEPASPPMRLRALVEDRTLFSPSHSPPGPPAA